MSTINLKHIETQVLDFIRKEEGKLPIELVHAAAFGEKYIAEAQKLLTSGQAVDFTAIVPAAEPFRTEILNILGDLDTAFHAVGGAFQKGTLLTAQSQIAALQVPGVSIGHVILAAQAGYMNNTPASTRA